MALKIAKKCLECRQDCKIYTDETLWENFSVIACPKGSKGFKRIPKSQRKSKK